MRFPKPLTVDQVVRAHSVITDMLETVRGVVTHKSDLVGVDGDKYLEMDVVFLIATKN